MYPHPQNTAVDHLVEGALDISKSFHIPEFIVGLTIVAFGTSAPELVVNSIASLKGKSDIIFGNILGSNIANILLILGMQPRKLIIRWPIIHILRW